MYGKHAIIVINTVILVDLFRYTVRYAQVLMKCNKN